MMGKVLGDEAEEQLRRAIEAEGTVDYSVSNVSSSPGGSSKPGGSAADYQGEVLVRRRGTLELPVDIDLIAKDGSVEHRVWDAHGDITRIPYRGLSPLVGAIVDPNHKILLDDDLRNNARQAGTSWVTSANGTLLERFAFALETTLTVLLP